MLHAMNNTLIKGLHLLDIMARHGKPVGVSELAVMAGMPKSGAHRLLQALVDELYVVRVPPASYTVSIKLWELGSAALWSFDLRRHADSLMETLMQSTGESVHLSVLDGREVVYVHKVECPNPIRAYSQIGGRSQAHCVATGKAMLAFRNPQWLTEISHDLSAATPHTITEPEKFLQEMQRVRRVGYAINRGEWPPGVNGLAPPSTMAPARSLRRSASLDPIPGCAWHACAIWPRRYVKPPSSYRAGLARSGRTPRCCASRITGGRCASASPRYLAARRELRQLLRSHTDRSCPHHRPRSHPRRVEGT